MDIMNDIGNWFKDNLKEFPLYVSLFIFGGLGAAYSNYSSAKRLNRKQRFVSITFGAFTALFAAILLEPIVQHLWAVKLSGAALSAIFGCHDSKRLRPDLYSSGKNALATGGPHRREFP